MSWMTIEGATEVLRNTSIVNVLKALHFCNVEKTPGGIEASHSKTLVEDLMGEFVPGYFYGSSNLNSQFTRAFRELDKNAGLIRRGYSGNNWHFLTPNGAAKADKYFRRRRGFGTSSRFNIEAAINVVRTYNTYGSMFAYNDGGRSEAPDYIQRDESIGGNFKFTDQVDSLGDCALRAIAIALELPYKYIWSYLYEQRKQNPNAVMYGVEEKEYLPFLHERGWTQFRFRFKPGRTVQDLQYKLRDSGWKDNYMVLIKRHIMAVVDNVLQDTWDSGLRPLESTIYTAMDKRQELKDCLGSLRIRPNEINR